MVHLAVDEPVDIDLQCLQILRGLGLVLRQLLGKILLALVERALYFLDVDLGVEGEEQRLLDAENLLHRAPVRKIVPGLVHVSAHALQVPIELLLARLHHLLYEVCSLLNISFALVLKLPELFFVREYFVEGPLSAQFALFDALDLLGVSSGPFMAQLTSYHVDLLE